MKRVTLFSVLFILFAIGASPATEVFRIKQITDRPYDLVRETVRLEGKVIKFAEVNAASSIGYWFEDNYGDKIKIITANENPPEIDRRYVVTGKVFVINIDKETQEVNIYESSRQIPQEDSGHNPSGEKNEKLVNVFFVLAAVLLLFIAILTVLLISGRYKEGHTFTSSSFSGFTDSGLGDYQKSSSVLEDDAIRMTIFPDHTLEILPGRLEAVKGFDVHKDIMFYKDPTQKEAEFTFGRKSSTDYTHFQLKAPGVSAEQARIRWTNGKYTLINYSTVNPTKVNDKLLAEGEQVTLDYNSTIEMGEIIFKFHEK